MELDPPLVTMLDGIHKYRESLTEMPTIEQSRAGYARTYRDRGIPRQDVAQTALHHITGPDAECSVQTYTGMGVAKNAPALIYFHGGGCVLGGGDAYEFQARALANMCKCVVFLVDYRLAPEHPFPAQINDAVATYDWVLANAGDLSVDPTRIVLAGDSAGGGLTVSTALHAAHSGGQCPVGIVPLYPSVDWARTQTYPSMEEFGTGYFLEATTMQMFKDFLLPEPWMAKDPRMSLVLNEELTLLPPTHFYVARQDPLYSMGLRLFEKMQQEGCQVTHHSFDDLLHNFMGFAGISPSAKAAFEMVSDRISTLLGTAEID